MPHPEATSNEALSHFQLIGQLIAGCVYSAEIMVLHFPPALWKLLVNTEVEIVHAWYEVLCLCSPYDSIY